MTADWKEWCLVVSLVSLFISLRSDNVKWRTAPVNALWEFSTVSPCCESTQRCMFNWTRWSIFRDSPRYNTAELPRLLPTVHCYSIRAIPSAIFNLIHQTSHPEKASRAKLNGARRKSLRRKIVFRAKLLAKNFYYFSHRIFLSMRWKMPRFSRRKQFSEKFFSFPPLMRLEVGKIPHACLSPRTLWHSPPRTSSTSSQKEG